MNARADREEGDPWAMVEMPMGCAQHGSAAMNMGVKCHMSSGEPHAASHRQQTAFVPHWALVPSQ